MYLQEVGWGAFTELNWLRTGTGVVRSWMWEWTIGFHKKRGISWM